MVDQDVWKLEEFDKAIARANSILLLTLEAKDVMATMMLPISEEKWMKLTTDYMVVSASMAVVARSRFQDSRMRDGDTVVET